MIYVDNTFEPNDKWIMSRLYADNTHELEGAAKTLNLPNHRYHQGPYEFYWVTEEERDVLIDSGAVMGHPNPEAIVKLWDVTRLPKNQLGIQCPHPDCKNKAVVTKKWLIHRPFVGRSCTYCFRTAEIPPDLISKEQQRAVNRTKRGRS